MDADPAAVSGEKTGCAAGRLTERERPCARLPPCLTTGGDYESYDGHYIVPVVVRQHSRWEAGNRNERNQSRLALVFGRSGAGSHGSRHEF